MQHPLQQRLHKQVIKPLINAVYPPICIHCHDRVNIPNSLCSACWGNIIWLDDNSCNICHFPFENTNNHALHPDFLCASCIAHPPDYDKARSVFLYNEASRKLVTQYKYGDKTHYAKTYSEWMLHTGQKLLDETDILCPVPLHWKRLLLRKYNQSALLTRHIAQQSHLPPLYRLLLKRKNNVPQASLTKKQRLSNAKGVFALNPRYYEQIQGKNITLIDDVTTTNATVNECAKILKKNGAAKVYVLTLAKTIEGE